MDPRAAFAGLAMMFATPALAASACAADSIGLDAAWPGMTVEQLRSADWPAGTRLICSGDGELPAGLDQSQRQQLYVPKAMAKARIGRCGLFTGTPAEALLPGSVPLAGNPAELWVMTIADDDGSDKVVEVYLTQRRQFFATTLDYLNHRFGDPTQHTPTAARWANGEADATLGPDQRGGIYLLMTDSHLQDLMQTRLNGAGKKH